MADAGGQPPGCRLQLLEQLVLNTQTQQTGEIQIQGFSYETLLDVLELLHTELTSSSLRREKHVNEFLDWSRSFIQRVLELRIRRSDFELIRVIGRGAFGEVSVVQMKGTNNIYAMKTLSKWDMLQRAEVACFREGECNTKFYIIYITI